MHRRQRERAAQQRLAISPPPRDTAMLKPDATPVCSPSTEPSTVEVSGATASDKPAAMTVIAGNTPIQ